MIVKLVKSVLWNESVPDFLAKGLAAAEPGRALARGGIAEYFGTTGKTNKISMVFGGVVEEDGAFTIKGLELFIADGVHKGNRVYKPTEEALAIGALYRVDPYGAEWKRLLAEIIVARDPRLRVVLLHMGFNHCHLVMSSGQPAHFTGEHGQRLVGLFDRADDGGPYQYMINRWLGEHCHEAIGPYWKGRIQAAVGLSPDRIDWRKGDSTKGGQSNEPSLDGFQPTLRRAINLLAELGVVKWNEDLGSWALDLVAAWVQLRAEALVQLVPPPPASDADTLLRVLQGAVNRFERNGMVPAHDLRLEVCRVFGVPPVRAYEFFDMTVFPRLERTGRLLVLRAEPGIPAHGAGLHNDAAKRLLKLAFV